MTENEAPISSQPPANDVGTILKQARLRRGQSYEVVFQHTRIPKKFLEALENNRFDEFPAAVYLQGFLKGYCEHLDVEFDPLWKQIRPSQPNEIKAAETARAAEQEQAADGGRSSEGLSYGGKPVAYLTIAGAVAVGAAILAGLFFSIPRGGPKPPPPPPLVQRPPEPLPPVVHAPVKMTLKLAFRNEAWVSLRCDGRLRFEGRGPAGFVQTWTAMKEFALRTSNPGDLSLEVDGREQKLDPAAKTASGEYLIKRP